jgi:hypothetical protein
VEAWLGFIGAIAGVIVGWGLTHATGIILERRKAARDLNAAAFVCLDRLRKIRDAKIDEIKKNERYLLGGDLDRYLYCIAANPKMWERHGGIYNRMKQILLQLELNNLQDIIDELDSLLKQGKKSRPAKVA